jgi:hypothetical protein
VQVASRVGVVVCHALGMCRWLDAETLGRSLAVHNPMHAIIAQRLCIETLPANSDIACLPTNKSSQSQP